MCLCCNGTDKTRCFAVNELPPLAVVDSSASAPLAVISGTSVGAIGEGTAAQADLASQGDGGSCAEPVERDGESEGKRFGVGHDVLLPYPQERSHV